MDQMDRILRKLQQKLGVNAEVAARLVAAGLPTVALARTASPERLAAIEGIGPTKAAKIRAGER